MLMRAVSGAVRTLELNALRTGGRDLVVWWYGGVRRNIHAGSVPLIAVFFRSLDANNEPAGFSRFDIAVTHLGLLRIGTVWRDGICTAESILETSTVETDFARGAWEFVSPSQYDSTAEASVIRPQDYQLRYSRDKNWLIAFRSAGGGQTRILVPCIEFLVRAYGCSAEVRRILTTYPWSEVERRFFSQTIVPERPGNWSVTLNSRMREDDAVYLAHVLHDKYARTASRQIYAQIEAAFSEHQPYAFPKIAPWFEGPATIRCEGIRVNGGHDFLCLRLIGISEPPGKPIELHRNAQTTASTPPPQNTDPGGLVIRRPGQQQTPLALTSDAEPDHGQATEVEDTSVSIIGERRLVVKIRHDSDSDGARTPIVVSGDNPSAYSTGEAHGASKGVGAAEMHASVVMDTEGALLDVWNALRQLRHSYPQSIQSVEWYTYTNGYCASAKPMLIALEPLAATEEASQSLKRWVYLDASKRITRGILVARAIVHGTPVHIVEIQRRPIVITLSEGSQVGGEEAYKGMVFVLKDEKYFLPWMRFLLAKIRLEKGVFSRLVNHCPGKADTFMHTPAKGEPVLCEAAVRNAFRKMGVRVEKKATTNKQAPE